MLFNVFMIKGDINLHPKHHFKIIKNENYGAFEVSERLFNKTEVIVREHSPMNVKEHKFWKRANILIILFFFTDTLCIKSVWISIAVNLRGFIFIFYFIFYFFYQNLFLINITCWTADLSSLSIKRFTFSKFRLQK